MERPEAAHGYLCVTSGRGCFYRDERHGRGCGNERACGENAQKRWKTIKTMSFHIFLRVQVEISWNLQPTE
jgi:hypothetical protein